MPNPLPVSLPAECRKCAKIFSSFCDPYGEGGLDHVVPASLLRQAKGFAIFQVVKMGFLVSARVGTGVVVARLPSGQWSAPSAIGTAGAGFGAQAGAEITDFLIILNSRSAVKSFMSAGRLQLGGNLSIAVGPIGRNTEGSAGLSTKGKVAMMYSYSKTRGMFGGVSVEGSVIVERSDANRIAYHYDAPVKQLLSGQIEVPIFAQQLIQAIEARAGTVPIEGWIDDRDQSPWKDGYAFGDGVGGMGNGRQANKKSRSRGNSVAGSGVGSFNTGGSSSFSQQFDDDVAKEERESREQTWGKSPGSITPGSTGASNNNNRFSNGGSYAARRPQNTTGFSSKSEPTGNKRFTYGYPSASGGAKKEMAKLYAASDDEDDEGYSSKNPFVKRSSARDNSSDEEEAYRRDHRRNQTLDTPPMPPSMSRTSTGSSTGKRSFFGLKRSKPSSQSDFHDTDFAFRSRDNFDATGASPSLMGGGGGSGTRSRSGSKSNPWAPPSSRARTPKLIEEDDFFEDGEQTLKSSNSAPLISYTKAPTEDELHRLAKGPSKNYVSPATKGNTTTTTASKNPFDFFSMEEDLTSSVTTLQPTKTGITASTQPPQAVQISSGNGSAKSDTGKAVCLYDFAGQEDGDLSFKKNEVIDIVARSDEEWWTGRIGSRQGIFPVNYVEVI